VSGEPEFDCVDDVVWVGCSLPGGSTPSVVERR
jgi:hypothetical protein